MGRVRRGASVAVIACAAVAAGVAPGAGAAGAGRAELRAAQQVTIQVWLKPDLAGATSFANAVATPGGRQFHRYLSPDAYTTRFGAPAAHAKAVAAWLTAQGLTQVRVSGDRDYVSATGAVSALTVPASLAPDVLGVTGLDGPSSGSDQAAGATPDPARATAAKTPTCSEYWAQHQQSLHPAYQGLTEGSLPVCGYSASQMRAAYGVTAANSGKGQTVALTDPAPPAAMFQTLTDYARMSQLPAPKRSQYRQLQSGTCGSSGNGAASGRAAREQAGPGPDDEPEMDSEAVYAMAPSASQLMVIAGGCDQSQSLLDAILTVLIGNGRQPSASIVSNSWVLDAGEIPAQALHAIDLRAAAEGVGLYFSSGDDPGLNLTSSDPYLTAVGGTTLELGAGNARTFETGWSDDTAEAEGAKWDDLGLSGAGGGTSPDWSQPAYQKGVVPASMARVKSGPRIVTGRAVPDISADADVSTGMLIGYIQQVVNGKPGPYQTAPNAGTSLASPLIAGLVADAQQGQKSAFGFINPLLYRLAGTRAIRDVLPVPASTPQPDRDSYTPASGTDAATVTVFGSTHGRTQQVIAKGYDTVTGVGTPNGAAFITGLRGAAR